MPIKSSVTTDQNISFPIAQAFCKKLELKGFVNLDLREMVFQNGAKNLVSVTDENWYDDGGKHEFYIKLWGSDAEVGMLIDELKIGSFTEWLRVASISYYSSNPAVALGQAISAVLYIKGVEEALDKVLKF